VWGCLVGGGGGGGGWKKHCTIASDATKNLSELTGEIKTEPLSPLPEMKTLNKKGGEEDNSSLHPSKYPVSQGLSTNNHCRGKKQPRSVKKEDETIKPVTATRQREGRKTILHDSWH